MGAAQARGLQMLSCSVEIMIAIVIVEALQREDEKQKQCFESDRLGWDPSSATD